MPPNQPVHCTPLRGREQRWPQMPEPMAGGPPRRSLQVRTLEKYSLPRTKSSLNKALISRAASNSNAWLPTVRTKTHEKGNGAAPYTAPGVDSVAEPEGHPDPVALRRGLGHVGADQVADAERHERGRAAEQQLPKTRPDSRAPVQYPDARANADQRGGGQRDGGDQRGGAAAEEVRDDDHQRAEREGQQARDRGDQRRP